MLQSADRTVIPLVIANTVSDDAARRYTRPLSGENLNRLY